MKQAPPPKCWFWNPVLYILKRFHECAIPEFSLASSKIKTFKKRYKFISKYLECFLYTSDVIGISMRALQVYMNDFEEN